MYPFVLNVLLRKEQFLVVGKQPRRQWSRAPDVERFDGPNVCCFNHPAVLLAVAAAAMQHFLQAFSRCFVVSGRLWLPLEFTTAQRDASSLAYYTGRTLDLSSMNLSGTVPSEIGSCTKLV